MVGNYSFREININVRDLYRYKERERESEISYKGFRERGRERWEVSG